MSKGARPPPPPPPSRDDQDDFWNSDTTESPAAGGLTEVERALSILDGRHPDHARLQRETLEASRARRAVAERESARERRRARRRTVVTAVAIIGLGGTGWFAYAAKEKRAKLDAMLDAPSAPFVAMGYAPLPAPSWGRQDLLDVRIESASCVIAVGASAAGEATIEVQRDGETFHGKGTLGWCSCGPEHVRVEATSGGAANRSVRLVQKDAHAFGGTYAFAFANARPATLLESPCAEEHLDGWLRESRAFKAAMSPAWLDATPARKKLSQAGFQPLAMTGATLPFVVVEPPPQSCMIAFGADAADRLSLRLDGGARPVSKMNGPLAWCDSHAAATTVWREGKGEITVISVPARRIGGALGLRETAARADLGGVIVWIAAEDLGWDAAQAARASGIPEPVVVDYLAAKHDAVRDARVVSISATEGAVVAPDTGTDLVFSVCTESPGRALQIFCVQASQQRWRDTSTKGNAGGAESALPFWMSSLAKTHEPEAVREEASLFGLARRLATEGFAPSVLEAVTELSSGADISGRAGEDAVVAVGIEPEPPYVFTYSDGPSWALGEAPRVVELGAGKHVILSPTPHPSQPKEGRRTVVFRRPVSPTP